MSEQESSNRTFVGQVVSNAMDKSITVVVERRIKHPVYGKYLSRTSKVHAHDESNECLVGDTVMVEQCRPLSKTKTWRLVKVLERAS